MPSSRHLDHGVRWTGTTIHIVDEQVDHGPIVCQVPVPVREGDTLPSLKARVQKAEYRAYPKAIKKFLEEKAQISRPEAGLRERIDHEETLMTKVTREDEMARGSHFVQPRS